MPFYASIYRTLLCLLLLLPVGKSVYAYGAVKAPESARGIGESVKADRMREERHQPPQEAVLSGVANVSPTASLHSGYGGPCGLYPGGVYTLPPSMPLQWSGTIALRRWCITASAVRLEQLHALYPAHAFW